MPPHRAFWFGSSKDIAGFLKQGGNGFNQLSCPAVHMLIDKQRSIVIGSFEPKPGVD